MNNIVSMYEKLKHVELFDDLVNVLSLEYGMPRRKAYSDIAGLYGECEMLAEDWTRYQYASSMRLRATVPDEELRGEVVCTAIMFYAVLKAGAIKPLYLMTHEASELIDTTALTESFEPEFFIENFSRPLVLYSGGPKPLFEDVLCVEMFYDEVEKSLNCLLSCCDNVLPSREFYSEFPVEELRGRFKPETIAIAEVESGESTRYMIRQGVVGSIDVLNEKFYAAMRYAFKFVLLRQCQKQIVLVESQYRKKNTNPEKQKQIFGTLNYQRVSLTTEYKTAIRNQQESGETLVLDKEGKELKATKVRGFLRRQHYGPENSLVKVVYIDAHESHSWMKTGIRYVKVVK